MESGNESEIYNKIDELCKRIEIYTTKAISAKSEVKNNIYAEKITKIIKMINYEAKIKGYAFSNQESEKLIQEEKIDAFIEENKSNDKYNPNSEEFFFKDKK